MGNTDKHTDKHTHTHSVLLHIRKVLQIETTNVEKARHRKIDFSIETRGLSDTPPSTANVRTEWGVKIGWLSAPFIPSGSPSTAPLSVVDSTQ